jgi:hypothetical protein
MHCGDKSVSGLVSVVFVYKSSLKMANPFSNSSDVEQRALILFFVVRRHKSSEIFRRILEIRKKKHRGLQLKAVCLFHDNARPDSAAAIVEEIGQLKWNLSHSPPPHRRDLVRSHYHMFEPQDESMRG